MSSGATMQSAVYEFVEKGEKVLDIDYEPWPSNKPCAYWSYTHTNLIQFLLIFDKFNEKNTYKYSYKSYFSKMSFTYRTFIIRSTHIRHLPFPSSIIPHSNFPRHHHFQFPQLPLSTRHLQQITTLTTLFQQFLSSLSPKTILQAINNNS